MQKIYLSAAASLLVFAACGASESSNPDTSKQQASVSHSDPGSQKSGESAKAETPANADRQLKLTYFNIEG
ncbi:MAG: hypothetical protein AB8H80_12180 [Planctomycetota bacterium]